MAKPLLGPPHPDAPIKALERLWLDTAYLYEELHETIMVDTDWDLFAKRLQDRCSEWSPYFQHCLPSADYNVGTTASGIDWAKRNSLPKLVASRLKLLDGDYSSLLHRHRHAYDKDPS